MNYNLMIERCREEAQAKSEAEEVNISTKEE